SPRPRRVLEQNHAVCLIEGSAILTYIRRCANQRCRFVAVRAWPSDPTARPGSRLSIVALEESANDGFPPGRPSPRLARRGAARSWKSRSCRCAIPAAPLAARCGDRAAGLVL